ncbi:MAG: hypothetical protein U0R80_05720 [Nocardioidaceae bacterium]
MNTVHQDYFAQTYAADRHREAERRTTFRRDGSRLRIHRRRTRADR